MLKRFFFFFLSTIALLFIWWSYNRLLSTPHTLILISMDGFRHDYIELAKSKLGPNSLKNFDRLIWTGIRAMESINTYPTLTLPNHETLVTGLHSEYHGVVANNIKDRNYPNDEFVMNDQKSLNDAPWLREWPEPIWVTLQKSGGAAGSILWPMNDQSIQDDVPFQIISQFGHLNNYPTIYDLKKRVTDTLWWLDNPHFKLDLILLYFNEPDETGHSFGPNGPEMIETIQKLNTLLGQLLDGIEDRKLFNTVDIILTADHGMSQISRDRLIGLDEYISPKDYTYTQMSTLGFLYPAENKSQEIYNNLKMAHPHLKVYWTHEVPHNLFFNVVNSRMPPLIVIPDPLWYIVHNKNNSYLINAGDHGYSTNFKEMHPFFIARGPSFQVNKTVPKVYAVDIYPLMCSLLSIEPKPNNGSLGRIASILKPKNIRRFYQHKAVNLSFLLLFLFLIITSTFIKITYWMKPQNYHLNNCNEDEENNTMSKENNVNNIV